MRRTSGCPRPLGIAMIWLASSLSAWAAPISGSGPFSFFVASNHRCGTRVSRLAMLCRQNQRHIHGQRAVLHKLLECVQLPPNEHLACCHSAFARFPVTVSDIQWYTHSESVFMGSTLPCHRRVQLIPFNAASSSAKLMCWASASDRSQQTSSNTVSRHSKATPIARELASTHTFSSWLSTHQSPQAGSSCYTDSMVSDIIRCSTVSLASSSQSFATELARFLNIPQATRSQLHTGRFPTSRPHKEKTVRRVTTLGTSGTTLSRFNRNSPCSILTANPSTCALSFNHSGILHFNPNCAGCRHTTSLLT